jgi:predicted ribosomally synthesized peptide with nif11-like leader
MNIDEKILSKLTDEQKKKVKAAKTPEELLAIAKEAGYELSADQLEAVSGGKLSWCSDNSCKEVCYGDGICGID